MLIFFGTGAYASQCAYREVGGQQLAGVSSVFQYLDPQDQSTVLKLIDKCLYPLNQLAGRQVMFQILMQNFVFMPIGYNMHLKRHFSV